jgi:hypothetical protein
MMSAHHDRPVAAGARMGGLHHVELWVPDLERAVRSWGWLTPASATTPNIGGEFDR